MVFQKGYLSGLNASFLLFLQFIVWVFNILLRGKSSTFMDSWDGLSAL